MRIGFQEPFALRYGFQNGIAFAQNLHHGLEHERAGRQEHASQHPAEHKVMEREHRVPVDQTEQPAGAEQSCLVEDALAFVTWFYSEVEQRFTR